MKLIQKVSSNPEPLLTTAAVAKWLGVATRTVCLWAECKEIPAIKIGRQWRFREGELREWLNSPQAAKVGVQRVISKSSGYQLVPAIEEVFGQVHHEKTALQP